MSTFPTSHQNNEKPPYVNGDGVDHVETEFGKVSILICADLVSEEVMGMLDADLDYLIVPMSRAFDGVSPDQERWEKEGRAEYVDVAKSAGIATMIANALEVGVKEPSFGGALIIDAAGELVAEAPHGTDEVLVWDF